MRLVSFGERGRERPGIHLEGRGIVDVVAALADRGVQVPHATLASVLSSDRWRDMLEDIARDAAAHDVVFDEVRLGAPIVRPGNVFVIGANTYSHVREAAQFTMGHPPKRPMVLSKATSSVTGPFDPIIYPEGIRQLDYEVELGVIVGMTVRSIETREALSAVAGYVAVNDVSARDVQLAEAEDNKFYRAHYLGKSFDTFCPMGPWLVTPDEIPDVGQLSLKTWVDGELRQHGSTSDLCFGVAELISYLSSVTTLRPGDLICTGSPAGVAAFRSPEAFLQPGNTVRCDVEGIGSIVNRVVG
jgi:2-keto-4-pentenoate hydratase/2-oxohepta-3-ene-1,7-dioic acid hydratase in catechol pathway